MALSSGHHKGRNAFTSIIWPDFSSSSSMGVIVRFKFFAKSKSTMTITVDETVKARFLITT